MAIVSFTIDDDADASLMMMAMMMMRMMESAQRLPSICEWVVISWSGVSRVSLCVDLVWLVEPGKKSQ